MVYKLKAGFGKFGSLWIILLLFILEAGGNLLARILNRKQLFLYYLLFVPMATLPFALPASQSVPIVMTLAGLSAVLCLWKKGEQFKMDFPLILVTFAFNFFLITILAMGVERWIQVIDFVFILVALQYLITYIKEHLVKSLHG